RPSPRNPEGRQLTVCSSRRADEGTARNTVVSRHIAVMGDAFYGASEQRRRSGFEDRVGRTERRPLRGVGYQLVRRLADAGRGVVVGEADQQTVWGNRVRGGIDVVEEVAQLAVVAEPVLQYGPRLAGHRDLSAIVDRDGEAEVSG